MSERLTKHKNLDTLEKAYKGVVGYLIRIKGFYYSQNSILHNSLTWSLACSITSKCYPHEVWVTKV